MNSVKVTWTMKSMQYCIAKKNWLVYEKFILK